MASVRQYKLNITLARQLTLIQVIFRDGASLSRPLPAMGESFQLTPPLPGTR